MEWLLEDRAGVEYAIDVDSEKLDRFYDDLKVKPSEATIEVPRRVPAWDKQWIRAVEDGQTKFLGYISRKPRISGIGKKTITANGVEALLWKCPCPRLSYFANYVALQQVFDHIAPDDGDYTCFWPGLLFAANSQIPDGLRENSIPDSTNLPFISHGPGEVIDETDGIVKYKNLGLKSRVGLADIFINGAKCTNCATYTEMEATEKAVFRDANDLYIRFRIASYRYFGLKNISVYAENAFDTRVRKGLIDSDAVLATQLAVGPENQVGDVLHDLAAIHGLNTRFRYAGKLCYLDALEDFSDDGIFDIPEEECDKLEYKTPQNAIPDAVTCTGHGSRLIQQVQSIFNVKPGGAYVRKVADFPNTFFDKNQTLKEYYWVASPASHGFNDIPVTNHFGRLTERSSNKWYQSKDRGNIEISIEGRDDIPVGADVRIIADDATNTYQIQKMSLSSKNMPVITIGKKNSDILDAIEALQSNDSYIKEDMIIIGDISVNKQMSVDWVADGTGLPVTDPYFGPLPGGTFDPYTIAINTGYSFGYYFGNVDYASMIEDYNMRVLMDFSVEFLANSPASDAHKNNCQFYLGHNYYWQETVNTPTPGWQIYNFSTYRSSRRPGVSVFHPQYDEITGMDITKDILFGPSNELIVYLKSPYAWPYTTITAPDRFDNPIWPNRIAYDTLTHHISYLTARLRLYIVSRGVS
ncbi:hypothetical protein M0R72_19125 [Candidatus Pacearchaeota archaeon]|jgi:hypothetical protein|nr:hypothetical protein [Candidatus Pacearchaeota archaeon]